MHKKQLIVCWIATSLLLICGCTTYSTKYPHIGEASLVWYAYGSRNNFADKRLEEEYQKKIDRYLLFHPQTSKEIVDKMRKCRVMLGMTEEQLLAMVKPNRISRAGKKKKIFQYSDVSRFGWTQFIGEGIRVRVTLTNGVVTDISELDTVLGA